MLISTYLQLGHQSDNLLREDGLGGFAGVILSPVNYDPESTRDKILPVAKEQSLDLVFDPQLYNPRSDRTKLNAWSYFPNGFDTADSGDPSWWHDINIDLANAALEITANKVCSPSILPRTFDDSYYGLPQFGKDLTG